MGAMGAANLSSGRANGILPFQQVPSLSRLDTFRNLKGRRAPLTYVSIVLRAVSCVAVIVLAIPYGPDSLALASEQWRGSLPIQLLFGHLFRQPSNDKKPETTSCEPKSDECPAKLAGAEFSLEPLLVKHEIHEGESLNREFLFASN